MAEEFTLLRKSRPVIIAAGVALMGQSDGKYTFFGHPKWTPVIALGYAAGILVHLWMNARLFNYSNAPKIIFVHCIIFLDSPLI